MHNLKELKIWQKAIDIGEQVYLVTKSFPKEEKYGMISQIRRAAISISSNIAEGAGRNYNKEFIQFLGIANGSCFEVQSQLVLSIRLNLISETQANPILALIEELQKMMFRFKSSLINEASKLKEPEIPYLLSNISNLEQS